MSMFDVEEIIRESLLNEDLYEYCQLMAEGGTAGIPHEIRDAEKNVQYNVLKYLGGDDNDVVMNLIDLLGGYFRKVIKEFRKDGRIPSEDELIKYTTKYYGKDIVDVAKGMKG
jgi:hypothetical protein